MDEIERNKSSNTSTISTIAVQSGSTRIVIALLQSRNRVELKVLDMVPDMMLLGETLEEASNFESTHNNVILQIQNKQSPVEELLKKADKVIAEKKPKAEVYSAMADSLGQAWKDVNAYLMMRKRILHLNVAYLGQAESCKERMTLLEKLCSSSIPTVEVDAKESLQYTEDVRRSMLECLLGTLKAGQDLLVILNEMVEDGPVDSHGNGRRNSSRLAVSKVECWLEELHDRRRLLDVAWQKFKSKCQNQRALVILKADLDLLEGLVQERLELQYRSKEELGDTVGSAEVLLSEHCKLIPEAKNLQEEAFGLVRAAEQLTISTDKADDMTRKAYEVLDLASEYIHLLHEKELLLQKCITFFRSVQNVTLRLVDYEKKLNSTDDVSARISLLKIVEEITLLPIDEGRLLLEQAPYALGVKNALQRIEDRRLNVVSAYTKLNEDSLALSYHINTFYEKYNQIFSWIVTKLEASIQGHQDMGSNLPMAKDFLQLHQQLLYDMQARNEDLNALIQYANEDTFEQLESDIREDIYKKINTINDHWSYLRDILQGRIRLCSKYIEIHEMTSSLANEMDSFEKDLQTDDSDDKLSYLEYRWSKIQQNRSQLIEHVSHFLNLPKTDDSYLDEKRAAICAKAILEHFANREAVIVDKWHIWKKNVLVRKRTRASWKKNMEDSSTTIDWVSKLDTKLYPVLSPGEYDTSKLVQMVNDKLTNIVPEIKKAQQEIQLRIKTAEELLAKGKLDTEEDVPPKLKELYNDVCSVIIDYTVLLEMFTSFFNSAKEVENRIEDLRTMLKSANKRPANSEELQMFKDKYFAVSQSFLDQHAICRSECQRLINKIKQQEPAKASEKDIECIQNILEDKQTEWENLLSDWDKILKRFKRLLQFDIDLTNLDSNINELSDELSSLRQNYNLNLSSAKSSSITFQFLEKSIQTLEHNMDTFTNSMEELIDPADSQHVEIDRKLSELKDKWNSFFSQVSNARHLIDLSIRYFTLVEEIEEWFRDGTKLLVSVARKSSTAKTPEEAAQLLEDIDIFMKTAESIQEEKIQPVSKLAIELFGEMNESSHVQQILAENNDMIDSFSAVSRELVTLEKKLKENITEIQRIEKVTADKSAPATTVTVEEVSSPLNLNKVEMVYLLEEMTSSIDSDTLSSSITSQSPPTKKSKIVELQPPTFSHTLKDVTAQEGSKCTFECRVSGSPVINVNWTKDGKTVQADTSFENDVCTLTIENVAQLDSGRYVCSAINESGKAETACTFNVIAINKSTDELLMDPPSFVIPLSNKTVNEDDACELYCRITGNPLPVVQWYKNDVCIDIFPEYSITYNNGDAKLFIERTKPDDQSEYSCTAMNNAGTKTSTAKLTVNEKISVLNKSPEIPVPLSSVISVVEGEAVNLTCSVSGHPFPTLIWSHNDRPIVETQDIQTNVTDDGRISLVISKACQRDAGSYKLIAKNPYGEVSTVANVLVENDTNVLSNSLLEQIIPDDECKKPDDAKKEYLIVETDLKDLTVDKDAESILECVIVGHPEPEVIWYHNDRLVKESQNIRLSFKGDRCTLRIEKTTVENDGRYKVVAVNSAGKLFSTCHLSVVVPASPDTNRIIPEVPASPAKFSKLLTDILVREGDDAILECAVTGYPKPSIKWIFNTEQLFPSERIQFTETEEGDVKLIIKNTVSEDKGLYTVRASNSLGQVKCFSHVIIKSLTSSDNKPSTHVRFEEKREFPSFREVFPNKTVEKGEHVKFECIATGKPAPKVKWYFNNEVVNGKDFLISTSGDRQVLTIPEVDEEHNGIISCIAENELGKATCSAGLEVKGDTRRQLVPTNLDLQTNLVESSQTFEMKRSVFVKSTIDSKTTTDRSVSVSQESMQKKDNEDPIRIESHFTEKEHKVDGVMDAKISSQSLRKQDTDHQSNWKTDSKTALITKSSKKQTGPRFISTVNGVILDEGSDAVFEVVFDGYPVPEIMWSKNNSSLSSINDKVLISKDSGRSTLTLKRVKSNDTGRYTCTITNPIGTSSCTADLVVKKKVFPPVMGRRLHPQNVAVGERVTFEIEVTGTPDPTVFWFKDDRQLAQMSPFYRIRNQGSSHALIFEKVRLEDTGHYKVKAFNDAGESISVASLNAFEPVLPIINSTEETVISTEKMTSKSTTASSYHRNNSSSSSITATTTSTPATANSVNSPKFSAANSSHETYRYDHEEDQKKQREDRIPPVWRPSSSLELGDASYKPVKLSGLLASTSSPLNRHYENFENSVSDFHTLPRATSNNNTTIVSNSFEPIRTSNRTSDYQTETIIKPYGGSETVNKSVFSELVEDNNTSRIGNTKITTKVYKFNEQRENITRAVDSDISITNGHDVRNKSIRRQYSAPNEGPHSLEDGNYFKQSSSAAETRRLQRVEQMRKRFEDTGGKYAQQILLPTTDGQSPEFLYGGYNKTATIDTVGRQECSELIREGGKINSHQFVDNIVTNISNKQNELRNAGSKSSRSLYSPVVLPGRQNDISSACSRNAQYDFQTELDYGDSVACKSPSNVIICQQHQQPQKAPIFTTPMHDIAVVVGCLARFECIVQAEPMASVVWKKNGCVLNTSELCHIYMRNGVCRLTLPKTYMYDAGMYHCIATNHLGIAETSAVLTVSGERRSFITK